MSRGLVYLNRSILAIIIGFVVEYFTPTIDPHIFRYPLNIILLLMVIVGAVATFTQYRESRFTALMRSRSMSIVVISLFAFFALLIGVIPQDGFMQRVDDGGLLREFGLFTIAKSYPFIATTLVMLFSLAGVVAQHITRCTKRSVMLWVGHLGLWLILASSLFGAADYNVTQTTITEGSRVGMGVDSDGRLTGLDFTIKLNRFLIDYYDGSGVAKHYASEVEIGGREATIEVNNPLRIGSHFIYQTGYDLGSETEGIGRSTTLKIVYDPYVWVWYVGVVMLVLCALLMFVSNVKFRDGV